MIIYCDATVENPMQQANLIECIELIGGRAEVKDDKISVDFEGSDGECDLMMSLFEHYTRHNITVIN